MLPITPFVLQPAANINYPKLWALLCQRSFNQEFDRVSNSPALPFQLLFARLPRGIFENVTSTAS